MSRRMRCAIAGTLGAVVLAVPTVSGCSPSPVHGRFDSPNPAAKLYAVQRAAREGDQSAIPHIIEQLDSEDPAVRLVAIAALYRLTGETYGYDHAAPRDDRDAAIRRWVEAYSQDEPNPVKSALGNQHSGGRSDG